MDSSQALQYASYPPHSSVKITNGYNRRESTTSRGTYRKPHSRQSTRVIVRPTPKSYRAIGGQTVDLERFEVYLPLLELIIIHLIETVTYYYTYFEPVCVS